VDNFGFEPKFFSLQGRGFTVKLVAHVQAGFTAYVFRGLSTFAVSSPVSPNSATGQRADPLIHR
jgi:hypothetical protein